MVKTTFARKHGFFLSHMLNIFISYLQYEGCAVRQEERGFRIGVWGQKLERSLPPLGL